MARDPERAGACELAIAYLILFAFTVAVWFSIWFACAYLWHKLPKYKDKHVKCVVSPDHINECWLE